MKNLSTDFKRALARNHRNYLAYADITWPQNQQGQRQTLALNNTNLWAGGFSYEELVSEDEEFTALGSVYMGTAKLIINNIDESYTPYVFEDAESMVLQIGMEFPDTSQQSGKRIEKHKIGTYHAAEVKYDGTIVSLSLQDNIAKFDKPYSASKLTYPATLIDIVNNCCTICNVQLANNSLQFPHYNYVIKSRPDDDAITCRDVISWVATIAGCFVKCNPDGQIEFKWFNQQAIEQEMTILDGGTVTPWSTGQNVNGGTVTPWSTGEVINGGTGEGTYNFHTITSLYSQTIALDDIVITGLTVQIDKDVKSSEETEDSTIYSVGTTGYIISITNNKFFNAENAQEILTWLGNQLIGFRFRKLNITIPNTPAIESGDVMLVYDRKGRGYASLVTRTSFSVGGTQEIVSGGSTPTRNKATQYSAYARSIVEARRLAQANRTAFDSALEDLGRALDAKTGLYPTEKTTESGSIYYLHDRPKLEDSSTVIQVTSEAIGITTNYNRGVDTEWNWGVTVDGTTITKILVAIGVNANWIRSGNIKIVNTVSGQDEKEIFYASIDSKLVRIAKDVIVASSDGIVVIQAKDTNGNETFYLNSGTGVVRINATSFSLSGRSVNQIASNAGATAGADAANTALANYDPADELTQAEIFNLLTGGTKTTPGSTQGIWLNNGKVYLNFSYARGGALTLGGANNGNGTFNVLNADNNQIIAIDNNGTIFRSTTADEYIKINENIIQGYAGTPARLHSWIDLCADYAGTGSSTVKWMVFETSSYSKGIKLIAGGNGSIELDAGSRSVKFLSKIDAGQINSSTYIEAADHFYTPGYVEAKDHINTSGNVECYSLTVNGTPPWTTSSDRRLKKNIEDAEEQTENIKKLKVHQFDWKDDSGHVPVGLVAQELQEVYPELVKESDNGLRIDYINMVPYLVKTIQEQNDRINLLEQKLNMLEKKLEKLI